MCGKLKQGLLASGLAPEPPNLDNYNTKHKRNCTVVALAAAAGLPYDEAHNIAEKAGRLANKGFRSAKLLKYFNSLYEQSQFRKIKRTSITVQKFCQKYPQGRYYVRKKKHAYAIIDGTIIDRSRPKALERILEAWQFVGDLPNPGQD